MANEAESQRDPIEARNWESSLTTQPIAVTELRKYVVPCRALAGFEINRQMVQLRSYAPFAHDSNGKTSVAMNGSVRRGDAAMARAADNIARWKTYLPEDCVRTMMNHGWHWST
jgi:hypothetical protein